MRDSLVKYQADVVEFLNEDTLKAIDYGILDLGNIRDYELKMVLRHVESILTLELKLNYRFNSTGIFRVSKSNGCWCYRRDNHIIRAPSIRELKEHVIRENQIWYVFDEILAENILRR